MGNRQLTVPDMTHDFPRLEKCERLTEPDNREWIDLWHWLVICITQSLQHVFNNTKCYCLYLPRGRFCNRSFAFRNWNESPCLYFSVFLFQRMTDSRHNSEIRKIVTTWKYMKQDRQCDYKRHIEPNLLQSFLLYKSNKYYIFCVCICSLSYPALTAIAAYCLVMCNVSGFTTIFPQ